MFSAIGKTLVSPVLDRATRAEISQEKLYRTYIERSYTDTGIFNDLRARGELTVRVQTMLPLAAWADLAGRGIRPGGGDEFIRYGVLKDFVDGSLMFAPLNPASADTGSFTFRFESEKRAIVDGSHKLIHDRRHNTVELYDLVRDPKETRNLADDDPARALALRARLLRAMEVLELDATASDAKQRYPARTMRTVEP